MLRGTLPRLFRARAGLRDATARGRAGHVEDVPEDAGPIPTPGPMGSPTNRPRYIELCQLTSFCFDSMEALTEFASVTAALPIRHVQMVLHTSHLLYYPPARHLIASEEHDGWMLKLNTSWERQLQAVDAVCREMPGLTSVLLSVHPEPRFARLVNEEAVVASLRAFTAAPKVVAEVFGGKGRVVLRGG